MNDNKIKHLEMVQNIINRIANHKPQYKGWFITLIIAINVFAISKITDKQLFLVFIVTLCFWTVTSYYLYLERLYIELYKDIRRGNKEDFDMEISDYKSTSKFFKGFISLSHLIYYIIMVLCLCYFNLKYIMFLYFILLKNIL
ncbi:hypothetical protein QI334_08435 [Staphylococcus saprophyticus]|uniref:hypothetical protein n=1 Tax=Staphylococcus saprophyticus TaxID=29385 RepID=UPI00076B67B3|nr:hypothetical protein [Staphylococcus saprophyticus]AMG19029.1 hypothetical protein AL528_01800 [Staphylococcus saprophyticus]MDW3863154.1 hypothetical protein [Staphylococcus saprophyticus]MDW3915132.1 hypothetical protein [Staphylococcus saprophyticus]MDW3925366.1 hypothetical protein [Staphylococcus saprophyticus]MDW3963156.1 hypothetical protein [Staphylococcus saprophyticus]